MANGPNATFEATASDLLKQLPPVNRHFIDLSPAEVEARSAEARQYREVLREKLEGKWFAALVPTDGAGGTPVAKRLASWRELMEFIGENNALVEVWAYTGSNPKTARRVSALEIARLKKQEREQPTFITLTYPDPASGRALSYRVEFAFQAADVALAASQGYERHRQMQLAGRKVLSARDAQKRVSAIAQWEALQAAVQGGELVVLEMPAKPTAASDPFVAFEYQVDGLGNYQGIVRVYRDSEIEHRVVTDARGEGRQVLLLKKRGEKKARQALGFTVDGTTDQLLPASGAVPGQDVVEMRVEDAGQPEVRKWDVLEFGEPEVLKDSALAKFSLISAYMQKRQKEFALEKSKYDLIAEPIIAALSIGGGVAGVGFPLGEAARLGYNTLVAPWMIPPVPTVKQMRELFQLMAAKDRDPKLRTKPTEFLDEADFRVLRDSAKDLSEAEVVDYLQRVSAEDLRGMVRLARMQQIDAQVSNLLAIMADAGKVSGWTDEAGFQRDVFNSIYFSVTGDVSIKNIIAVLAGGSIATPNSGVSLYDLSRGNGPAEAWLQFLDFTVDIRAVVNTIARVSHRTLTGKELRKPFPYAPRMSDLSAYEIRIFGFPLLLFYKRGLIKEDYNDFENDYAYGLIGTTIVEEFPTRADLDAEIRAGRMVPLGYVRVLGADGKWKETNLAVFAHRIPSGKRAGKTAVIIYGLKAYAEQSQLMTRELMRFQQFDNALREGGVIERVVDGEDLSNLPPSELEPQLHVGAQAVDESYAPVLGGLLEWRRYLRHRAWGLPQGPAELEGVAGVLEDFASKDIWLDDGDCLLGLDRFNSNFVYRRHVRGKWRVIKLTNIPSLADVSRDVAKAEDAQQLEQRRRAAVSERGHGIALINRVQLVNGRPEIGPLERVEDSLGGLQALFDRIDLLPVTDRARLHFNHFAGTLIDLDLDGTGQKERFFLTLEFPLGKTLEREWTNPLSGERERLVYQDGLWTKAVSASRILEIDYGASGEEVSSHTYANTSGSLQTPTAGALLEETRTLETWQRDLSRPAIDPYLPNIAKLKINHVTGQMTREIYGLFPLPVAVVDDQFVTYNQFNDYGVFTSAKVFENGKANPDFERPLLAKLTDPVIGRERFQLASTVSPAQLSQARSMQAQGYRTTVRREDMIKGLSRIESFDTAHWGRKISESYTDRLEGTNALDLNLTLEYRDDFYFGQIPVRSTQGSSPPGKPLLQIETKSYDPSTRRLVGLETDYTGRIVTNIWDHRWEGPVETETALRKTVNRYNHDGTEVTGTTVAQSSGEEVARFDGRFDPISHRWQLNRVLWYRPGITNPTQSVTLSSGGRTLAVRTADTFEARPIYGPDGVEQAAYVYRRSSDSAQFNVVHQLEDDYQWTAGERNARIQLYVNGQPYDSFRRGTDAEGRTTLDGQRQIPGLELKTVITYDGASERPLKAETFQNNQLRLTQTSQSELRQADGSYFLPVKGVPYWGLSFTEVFRIGDPLARAVSKTFEDGASFKVTEWFEGTALPRTSEVRDRHDRPKKRFNTRLNAGLQDGVPYDLVQTANLNPWGGAALAAEQALVRGTDVPLFTASVDEKTYYALGERFDLPLYATDPSGKSGLGVVVGGARKDHVLTVFSGRLQSGTQVGDTKQAGEQALVLRSVDLRGLLAHKISIRTLDRAGNPLDETVGKIPLLTQTVYSDQAIFQAAAQVTPTKRFHYRYDRGWLVERPDPDSGGRRLEFTEKVPEPARTSWAVNDGPFRDLVTEIDGIKAALEELQPTAVRNYFFRRTHQPVLRERNPFLPGCSNVWTAWTATELNPDGEKLFDSELIYDAQGRLSVTKTTKTTSSGQPGSRVAYNLPDPDPSTWKELTLVGGTNSFVLDLAGATNFAATDFIYFQLENTNRASWSALFKSASGRQVRVQSGDPDMRHGEISTWPLGNTHVRWLPDRVAPEHGALVTASHALQDGGSVVVVAAADLARAGLDLEHGSSATLQVQGRSGTHLRLSPVRQLVWGRRLPADREENESSFATLTHSSGLSAVTKSKAERTKTEILGGLEQEATLALNGLPIATVRPRTQIPVFPTLVLMDNSDADAPRPLYALSLRDGRFLEHYQMPKWGDAQVYTVVNGFEVPRYDVFKARFLDDEVTPSFTAYGYDYAVTLENAKGQGLLARAGATLRNRIAANVFKLGGGEALQDIATTPAGTNTLPPFSYRDLHEAGVQAKAINRLPMLAEALVLERELPWIKPPETQGDVRIDRKRLALRLIGLHVTNFLAEPDGSPTDRERRTGLIPTTIFPDRKRPGIERPVDDPERFVDTSQEAGIIELAVALNEVGLARALLDYYWQKSDGGTKPLHSSYDGETQASKAADPLYRRPPYAKQTAYAQLTVAEAAFLLWTKTRDRDALALSTNLISLTLDTFRHTNDPLPAIAEFQVARQLAAFGLRLWPEREVFSLRSNARAYLLLKRLNDLRRTNDLVRAVLVDARWNAKVDAALHSQEAWLRTNIVPDAKRTGVLPKGLFQVEDIHEATTAMALERWTSADDWLTFLEAAQEMGLPPTTTQRWLENLARVHGVMVAGIWGLDWSIPLLRPDAISPELTARFARVAELIGQPQAARFARQSLLALANTNGGWPQIKTTAAPDLPFPTGQGAFVIPQAGRATWATTLGVEKELIRPDWNPTGLAQRRARPETESPSGADLAVFVSITALFYLCILLSAWFWWRFRALRGKHKPESVLGQLVPDPVMVRAEERWAKRVLGVQTPATAEKTRFSNATVEQNFLMQLRAIYKLVLEWRRQENGWAEDDPRLAEGESDDWLNGLDEFASLVGIYMRWVIKAGAKDGFEHGDFLKDNEDSNHIWSRLVMYFAEYYWAMQTLLGGYQSVVTFDDKADYYGKFSKLLDTMGVRQRDRAFDARKLFNYPANPLAFDLLVIQKQGMTLEKMLLEVSLKLKIPYTHAVAVIEKYKQFKRREAPYPIHPYVIEFAKIVPHFLLMGLGALVWFNQTAGESPIVPYLWSVLTDFALEQPGRSLLWGLPLFASLVLSVLAYITRVYRFEGSMLPRGRPEMLLDATLTSLFVKSHDVLPKIKPGREWNPEGYERIGWALRAIGFLGLGWALLEHPAPSFATFLILKGMLAMLAFIEVAAIALPIALTLASKALQDRVSTHPGASKFTRFLNQLNWTATRPASPLWLAIKYHTQPSVPSGSFWGLAQTVVFYFLLGGVFFFVGAFLCQEMFPLWFTEKYLAAADWRLFFGGLFFWNTMYLLRYGLFLLFSGAASALVAFPIKTFFSGLAGAQLLLLTVERVFGGALAAPPAVAWPVAALGLVAMLFEERILAGFRRVYPFTASSGKRERQIQEQLERVKAEKRGTLGVVYMSGDDLSSLKLTPALLMTRWQILRDKLDSDGVRLLFQMAACPSDAELEAGFKALYETEKAAEVTLWHPVQLCVAGEVPRFQADLGLTIPVGSLEERQQLLGAWHLRRWLVTMMSTAGHAQDTAINLVDIALRLNREGLAEQTAFYLIQNKYDNNDNNRPVQTAYDKGELGQRNKLARLLCALAPGLRAYSVQNWTPFGFKAGGLTGMDLIHEETLKLTTMLVLDRNANVHDLDALMKDLALALTDPDLVIIIPGRGTTNTLTPLGQGSQMVEEGHRSFLKGLMGCLGGTASESVGTGWGNLLAVLYGQVQRAMVDPATPKMPLTSRMKRGSSFQVRTEGLIGFTPHAVGISEDTWAVSQAMHNAIALRRRVKFQVSQAIWHKIRETWSHSEWLASFPRWSGGYLQMMHDPLMQKINDFGPVSVFAKEVRANSGRNFLTAPFALLNILLMPLAIMLDVTPFVQILVVLWNFGFVMNQILTVHGLNTYLESSGFYRVPALLGAGAAALASALIPGLGPAAPALVLFGFLTGGFFTGLSRWLFNRVRDMILFGPQLVLHALGQVIRQSLEFTVSGASPEDAKGVNMAYRAWAGPREDRPHDLFANLINLKTIVWVVGLFSVILNIFALSNLDMLNVLLLLPSLLFSVSTMVGPFLMTPKVGERIGKWIVLPKILGWLTCLAFYSVVSMLIGSRPAFWWIGAIVFCGLSGLLLQRALRYARFRGRLSRLRTKLGDMIAAAGAPLDTARNLASQIIQNGADPAKARPSLSQAGLPIEQQVTVLKLVESHLRPLLRGPVQALGEGRFAQNRFVSAFSRSFVLAAFVLLWFFIVPVPGLFVFTAGEYRICIELTTIIDALYRAIGLTVASYWIGLLIERLARTGFKGGGLAGRIERAYRQFQNAARTPGRLSDQDISGIYALFTDAQTYLDQRSYEHANRSLTEIQTKLHLFQ